MINPNQLGRRMFPASASQWMLVGLRGGAVAPPGLADGDPVSSWADSSGNVHTATQTGSARPTFKTNIVNGKPVVRFNQANSQSLNLAGSIAGTPAFTIIEIVKAVDAAGPTLIPVLASTTADGTTSPALWSDGNIYFGNANGGLHSMGTHDAAFHIISATSNLVGVTAYVDGTLRASPFLGAGTLGNFNVIGQRTTSYANGDIAEIIIYNSVLSDTDRANIEKYLGTKYGITVAGGSAVQPDTVSGLQGWWKADGTLT